MSRLSTFSFPSAATLALAAATALNPASVAQAAEPQQDTRLYLTEIPDANYARSEIGTPEDIEYNLIRANGFSQMFSIPAPGYEDLTINGYVKHEIPHEETSFSRLFVTIDDGETQITVARGDLPEGSLEAYNRDPSNPVDYPLRPHYQLFSNATEDVADRFGYDPQHCYVGAVGNNSAIDDNSHAVFQGYPRQNSPETAGISIGQLRITFNQNITPEAQQSVYVSAGAIACEVGSIARVPQNPQMIASAGQQQASLNPELLRDVPRSTPEAVRN